MTGCPLVRVRAKFGFAGCIQEMGIGMVGIGTGYQRLGTDHAGEPASGIALVESGTTRPIADHGNSTIRVIEQGEIGTPATPSCHGWG
uniref:Uncharacterized protein n=1 Tax=Candidatus Kentrum sp. UNK TaxID=2126344 RepID=A0A451B5L4_9GAMM|nr:MAG: hypothetical protein BECKUNK1418G_GA0071005_12345 [Candidatus Kentron sp. UNK]VFK73580.1 MAG: hypothetical protein BECKUNK1418H_GA0071006_12235 [Candidatus Kentron sp. UNK]